jgi:crotonobetainyl-CoA:carnitine CoA-transferase CaiB-like acyl-CoA transferase
MLWNRNKRSIVLDLKSEDGLATCKRLVASADVLVENFKPGVAERLGLGYDALKPSNPRLIYCSISGFGHTGPDRERGGFDLITQGMSGLMAVNGPPEGPPYRLPIAISDVAAGMFGAIGILSAMAARERTGEGQQIDVSLLDSAISFGVYEAANYFATNKVPERLGQAHRGSAPYQIFRTEDGWITAGSAAQHLWERSCAILGCEELIADPRFADNAARVKNNDVLVGILQQYYEREPSQHWLDEFEKQGIPIGPVLNHEEVFADPQVQARDMVVALDHPAAGPSRTLGIPVKLSATPGAVRRPAPLLGEHTEEVLAELATIEAAPLAQAGED